MCRIEGCYLAGWDICPSCARKERRRLVRDRNKMLREERGTQFQLGIQGAGRWCQKGCCDLDNPKSGDCRF